MQMSSLFCRNIADDDDHHHHDNVINDNHHENFEIEINFFAVVVSWLF